MTLVQNVAAQCENVGPIDGHQFVVENAIDDHFGGQLEIHYANVVVFHEQPEQLICRLFTYYIVSYRSNTDFSIGAYLDWKIIIKHGYTV